MNKNKKVIVEKQAKHQYNKIVYIYIYIYILYIYIYIYIYTIISYIISINNILFSESNCWACITCLIIFCSKNMLAKRACNTIYTSNAMSH